MPFLTELLHQIHAFEYSRLDEPAALFNPIFDVRYHNRYCAPEEFRETGKQISSLPYVRCEVNR